jgi:hypothetical protein
MGLADGAAIKDKTQGAVRYEYRLNGSRLEIPLRQNV